MTHIEQTSDEINEIFEIIRVVYDPTCLSFDPIDTILNNFNKALKLAINLNFSGVKEDLNSEIDDTNEVEDIINMALYSFADLLNWKSETIAIPLIKESQRKDLIPYFEKLNHLST